ncbi:hypothetical protein L484_002767 [Morus notabilis]|uniref:Uncharacterized protein n=1 Tax=Morus notabilis TaxID=981085 RepID=W9RLL8_9ROSA|nr:hypothetical protein L484_002767 [Morus notabilis]
MHTQTTEKEVASPPHQPSSTTTTPLLERHHIEGIQPHKAQIHQCTSTHRGDIQTNTEKHPPNNRNSLSTHSPVGYSPERSKLLLGIVS